jgi:hypothetical protein
LPMLWWWSVVVTMRSRRHKAKQDCAGISTAHATGLLRNDSFRVHQFIHWIDEGSAYFHFSVVLLCFNVRIQLKTLPLMWYNVCARLIECNTYLLCSEKKLQSAVCLV